MRRPEDRSTTGEMHLSQPTEDPGRERNTQNSGDLLRWQIGPPSPATDDSDPERRPHEGSTRSPRSGEDEIESLLGHCDNPE